MVESLDYVDKQALEYRRGFVLGLTLAEAMLLLLFVLLLVLVLSIVDRQREKTALSVLHPILETVGDDMSSEEIIRLFERSLSIERVENRHGVSISDNFIELVAEYQLQFSEGQSELVDILEAEKEQNLKLQEQVSELKSDNLTLQGQLAESSRRLTQAGIGGTLPSCWSTPEGRTQYLLSVSLEDYGLRVQETVPETRQFDRQRLPLEEKVGVQKLSMASFLEWTEDLYAYSLERECRFYVRVYDSTSAEEKELFKQLLFGVERHFYKLMLSQIPAEFHEPNR